MLQTQKCSDLITNLFPPKDKAVLYLQYSYAFNRSKKLAKQFWYTDSRIYFPLSRMRTNAKNCQTYYIDQVADRFVFGAVDVHDFVRGRVRRDQVAEN